MALVLQLGGCTPSETHYPTGSNEGGTDSTSADTTSNEVKKATLRVVVRTSGDDARVTDALGWGSGVVAGARVVIRRQGSATNLSGVSDSMGRVEFPDLLSGTYDVSAIRLLSATEASSLDTADADVNAFGGGVGIGVTAPSTDASITVTAGRRGSLVISELYRNDPFNATGQYRWGRYLEIYNNSDTSITLADKYCVKGFPGGRDTPNFPCSVFESIRNDPEGIWSPNVYAFPAVAAPLAPGRSTVIATDAIDHTALSPESYDLSSAGFEFPGASDVDNPRVPNMVTLGPNTGDTFTGHGFEWYEVIEVAVLAQATPLDALPTTTVPNSSRPLVRIPAENILDVLVHETVVSSPYPVCPHSVNERFDKQLVQRPDLDPNDVQRRVIGTLPDGRRVLLRTRTSSRDFDLTVPTPGFLP